ncbi:hypothetical protein PAPYR_4491 [Paratrimastix pyriformis]|uniref:PB1 domain-containing protein n=1 Tax=Paratrimastix pyriformis TaxID=342808 RepID=A0ABQ8UJQ0_9EUKA|nr:hypothetical protein PAPYR_4491 [Paratrimastix pyriformis]
MATGSDKVLLVLLVEGARNRRVLFHKNVGFEALKSMLAREFAPESVVEITYSLSDGNVFAIAADDSLEAYWQENPLPPLKITLTSVAASRHRQQAHRRRQPGQQQQQPLEPSQHPNPIRGAEPLPPLAMCTLRLEAIGLPPRTVEIAPDRVEAMRLEEFMGLLAAQFEGRPVAGAPAIGSAPEAVTGLVDSAESLHSVLRASLAQPVVLQVPLRPLPPTAAKAERKKLKRQKQKEQQKEQKKQPPLPRRINRPLLLITGEAAAPGLREDPVDGETGGIETAADSSGGSDVPADDPSRVSWLLFETVRLVQDEKSVTPPERARLVASVAKLLTTVRTDLPTSNPSLAELLFVVVGRLAVDPESRAAFGRAGVVGPLVSMLTGLPTSNPASAEWLFGDIANLAIDSENRTSFGQAGVVGPLVKFLVAHPNLPTTHPAVAEKLLGAIRTISMEAENRAAFGRAGVIGPLVGLLNAHPDLPATNPAVAEVLLDTIARLSEDPANVASFCRAGVVAPLVRLLSRLPTASPGVTNQLLRVVIRLSADPNLCSCLAAACPQLERFPGANPELVRIVWGLFADHRPRL